jgi:hypothetical protein
MSREILNKSRFAPLGSTRRDVSTFGGAGGTAGITLYVLGIREKYWRKFWVAFRTIGLCQTPWGTPMENPFS